MDTKLATTQIRMNQWMGVIQDQKASGLKVDQYCMEHSLSRHAFYYWLRKIKQAALQQAGFIEIPVPNSAPPSSFHTQMVIKTADLELSVNEDTTSELLSRVLTVIHHAQ